MNGFGDQAANERRMITEQAAEWLLILAEPTVAQSEAFVTWLRSSEAHLEEFLMVMALNQELGQIDLRGMQKLQEVLDSGFSRVVQLRAAEQRRPHPEPRGTPAHEPPATAVVARGFPMAWAAAIGVLLIGSAGWWLMRGPERVYTTDIGTQRAIELDDGSVVRLSPRSKVTVSAFFGRKTRDITLEGEADFNVKPDRSRPFRVHAGRYVVEALGTEFDVLRLPSSTTVSVTRGLVQISTHPAESALNGTPQSGSSATPPPVRLAAGEQARVDTNGLVERRAIEGQPTMTWRPPRLVFRDNTLEDIAAQFNRWNRTQIHIEDSYTAQQRFDGAFDADDPMSLVDFLRSSNELAIERRGANIYVRKR